MPARKPIVIVAAVAGLGLVAGLVAVWWLTSPAAPVEGTQDGPTAGAEVAADVRADPRRSGQGPGAPDATPAADEGTAGLRAPFELPGHVGEDGPDRPWGAAELDLHAASPDEEFCGDPRCAVDDPRRYRTEVHGSLAHEGLDRLLGDVGIEGPEAERLRAQLEANLAAFAAGPPS